MQLVQYGATAGMRKTEMKDTLAPYGPAAITTTVHLAPILATFLAGAPIDDCRYDLNALLLVL